MFRLVISEQIFAHSGQKDLTEADFKDRLEKGLRSYDQRTTKKKCQTVNLIKVVEIVRMILASFVARE